MIIRFFAGAAEAAGGPEVALATPVPIPLAAVKSRLAAGNEHLGRVLAVSAILADGTRLVDEDLVSPASTLEVLPPFAGG